MTLPAAVDASSRATPKIRPVPTPAFRAAAAPVNRTCTLVGAPAPLVADATHNGEDPTRCAAEGAVASAPLMSRRAERAPTAAAGSAAVAVPAAGRSTAGVLEVAEGADRSRATAEVSGVPAVPVSYEPDTGTVAGSAVCGGDQTCPAA